MKKILLGAHISYTKSEQLLGSIKDMIKINANSGAFYVSNSRGYNKFELNEEKTIEGLKLAKENDINIENIIVHSPLIGNIANTNLDSDIWDRTLKSYYEDLKTLEKIGIKYYNFHPGSSKDKFKGIEKVAKAINILHNKTKGHKTILLIETMMPKGNYIGINFEELKQIINLVKDKKRIGICMDTCHVWDAGYDIKNDLDRVLERFDNIIGLKYLKALHINDSKNKIWSGKDRHEAIGKGHIGLKAIKELVHHKKLVNLPKALETPYNDDNITRWIKEIKLLR